MATKKQMDRIQNWFVKLMKKHSDNIANGVMAPMVPELVKVTDLPKRIMQEVTTIQDLFSEVYDLGDDGDWDDAVYAIRFVNRNSDDRTDWEAVEDLQDLKEWFLHNIHQ